MENPNTTDLITPEQPAQVAKLLDSLPGLVGAIDQAILDKVGERLGFMLVVWPVVGGAVHATNVRPVSNAVTALKDLAQRWDAQGA